MGGYATPDGGTAPALRLVSIDLLRGLVIVLMALDHVRDFFAPTPYWPDDLSQTSAVWFFTRWITHFCAPVFVLLAGTSAFLREQKTGKAALARWLASRGLMLIVLEVTVISLSWQFAYDFVFLQVIWALGWSMLILAALIWLPLAWIAALSLLLIVTHNLFDPLRAQQLGSWWLFVHESGYITLAENGFGLFVGYPLLPWFAVMASGYVLGRVFLMPFAQRQRCLLTLGIVLTLLFVLLRAGNFYGDAQPWATHERGPLFTFMSFLATSKYPPSLLYLCMTLGPSLLLLAVFERLPQLHWRPLIDFGRTPLFFYLLHIPLIHALSWLWFQWQYDGVQPFVFAAEPQYPPGYVASVAVCYVAWAGVLVLMHVATRIWLRRRAARTGSAARPGARA